MKSSSSEAMSASAVISSITALQSLAIPTAGRFALKLLEKLHTGSLRLTLPGGQVIQFGDINNHAPGQHHANLRLHSWNVCQSAMKSGDVGFAESYIRGDWSTDHTQDALPNLLKLLIANRQAIESVIYGNWLGRALYRIKHLLNRNTRAGSKRNIHAHYDLGNNFYKLWLDHTMSYSSALYGGNEALSLDQAQEAKYRRALQELNLENTNNHILEIGSGWGGFAQIAAQNGQRITGITLSTEQFTWAKLRMEKLGLGAQSTFLLQDYRDTTGQFDAIVSIEMFEAVGEQYWDSYFECLMRNLKPGGRALVQSITIDESLFERYRASTDFIQQYIFPGGMLPTKTGFESLAAKHGLQVVSSLGFGYDYAHTLKQWREVFMTKLEAVRNEGFDNRFINTWEFYLAYCEAAFSKDNTNVYQFTLLKSK